MGLQGLGMPSASQKTSMMIDEGKFPIGIYMSSLKSAVNGWRSPCQDIMMQ